ncbi:MAG: AAA family ATPase [Dehalococcoidia bacterium]
MTTTKNLDFATKKSTNIIENIKKVIIGKDSEIELCVIALLCGGHVLIEDAPGLGKTVLAKTLANSTNLSFSRIQFTPDLLPADVTGVSIYNQKTENFNFMPGPIISQFVLADEINRASPKTQSALLEAMDEKQVTVENTTHEINIPFFVIATQNSVEYEGTYPLPEAQLDRFMFKINLGYPNKEEELKILSSQEKSHPLEQITQVITAKEILEIQTLVKTIFVDELIRNYIVDIIKSTRKNPNISLGSSPRGGLNLFRSSQALALIRGRDYVLPDDVKSLVIPALNHRVLLSQSGEMNNINSDKVLSEILDSHTVPESK